MTNARYKIVFAGELMPEAALHRVKDNLVRLFKSDRHKIEALFSGTSVTLKRDLTETEADKYLSALQRTGALARKEQELSSNLSLEATDQQPVDSDAAAGDEHMSCPKCGHAQAKASECTACGIVIEKYQAQLAEFPETVAMAASSTASQASPYATPKAQVAEELPPYAELKVFSLKGRIGRLRYLAWWAAAAFVGLALLLIAILLMGMGIQRLLGGVLLAACAIAFIVVSVLIGIQRLHDIGWSGWLLLLALVPVAGGVFSFLMLVIPGTSDANRYGPPPPPNGQGVKALALTCLLVLILGTLATIVFPQYQQYLGRTAQGQTEMHADSQPQND